jgi:hypothetical protein
VSAPIIVAVIALAGSLLSAALALYGQVRSASAQVRREAEATLSRYREPLVAAAYELQSRLFNILRKGFLEKYYLRGAPDEREYAVKNTLYLVGQYLGWTEILRRQIQFLNFGEVDETREIARLEARIRDVLASDEPSLGRQFMIWRGEQRAIGERMIANENGALSCMGYATFTEQGPGVWKWFQRLEQDIAAIAAEPNERLRLLQNELIGLIERLDSDRKRFPEQLERA